MDSKSLNEWGEICLKGSTERGLSPANNTDGDNLMLIVTEVAEAMEEVRTGGRVLYYSGEDNKPEGIGPELADIVLRVAQFAVSKGIDLDRMIQIKNNYNTTRPYKHGGKKL